MSSVQFVRIKLEGIDSENLLKLADDKRISVLIDSPNLAAEAPIAGVTAPALAEDLRTEQP